ncbi:unnamed protein product [Ixodes persulcatus]
MPVELVQACEENNVPDPHLRRKLVKLLGEAIGAHSASPTTYQVNKIALTIVAKYQSSFADITSTGDLIGDGTASLTRQLMVYLDNRRRPHRSTKRSAEPAECSAKPSKQAKETDSYGCVAWAPDCTPYTWDELEEKGSKSIVPPASQRSALPCRRHMHSKEDRSILGCSRYHKLGKPGHSSSKKVFLFLI